MTEIVIKINDEKLEYFVDVTFSTSINTIASSFVFKTFYEIDNYEFAKIEVLRNNEIIFTGKVFGKKESNKTTPQPYIYQCYSLTGILEDCTLPDTAFPIQTKNKSLKEIVESVCGNFDITVKIDSSAESEVNKTYTLQDQSPDKKVAGIINNLCSQHNLILSHNARGELIITKTITGNLANPPLKINSSKGYNYRSFYYKYLILGQQSILSNTNKQATAILSNIDKDRHVAKIQTDGDADITQKQADAMKHDSYKANAFSIEYHNFFANVGDFYIIDGIKTVCNSMNYNYKAGIEKCAINLLNYKVYRR